MASKSGEPMQDVVKAYLELAFGLTEASKKKAEKTVKKAAKELLGKSGATAAQLQTMAEELVTTGLQNREAITRIVRLELDRALGRVGLATAEEVATLTARIEDLEGQLREAKSAPEQPASTTNGSSPATASPVAAPPVAKKAVAKKAVAAPVKAAEQPAPPKAAEQAAVAEPVTTTPAAVAKRVKKAAPVVKAAPAKKAPAAKAELSQEAPIKGAAAARKPAKAVAKKAAKAVAVKSAAGVDAATAIDAVAKATSGSPEPVAPVAFSSAPDVPVAAKKAPTKKTAAKKAPARRAAGA